MKEIRLAGSAGFCFGVSRSVDMAEMGSAFPKPCSVPQSGSDTANADFQF